MSRATEAQLSVLHGVVARVLSDELSKDRTDPETGAKADVPAALIAQAIAFLKNNGIDAVPTSPAVQNVVHNLPFTDTETDS